MMNNLRVDGFLFSRGKDSYHSSEVAVEEVKEYANVVIFGGTGAGKSSLVNQLAGKDIADTSSQAAGCTLQAEKHVVKLGRSKEVQIFDTMGLNEADHHVEAIVKTYELIRHLDKSGGVRLLIFCVRAGRITKAVEQNWKLFHDVLCEGKVPVVLVINGLEQMDSMEEWWRENELYLTQYGIRPIGHACVTSIRGLDNMYKDKYDSSKQTLEGVLLRSLSNSDYTQDQKRWFVRVARHIRGIFSAPSKGSELQNALRKAGMTKKEAIEVVNKIEHTNGE